jgi:hypothetical protein
LIVAESVGPDEPPPPPESTQSAKGGSGALSGPPPSLTIVDVSDMFGASFVVDASLLPGDSSDASPPAPASILHASTSALHPASDKTHAMPIPKAAIVSSESLGPPNIIVSFQHDPCRSGGTPACDFPPEP